MCVNLFISSDMHFNNTPQEKVQPDKSSKRYLNIKKKKNGHITSDPQSSTM